MPEWKVDSVVLPHGAALARLSATCQETPVTTCDADSQTWRRHP